MHRLLFAATLSLSLSLTSAAAPRRARRLVRALDASGNQAPGVDKVSARLPGKVTRLGAASAGVDPHDLGALQKVRSLRDGIEDQLYAVHATDHFPQGGTITPHIDPLKPSFLTHFAIGQLVPSHDHGSWTAKPIAVLVPLKKLRDQAVNYMIFDTFTFGALALPAGSLVVAPKGTELSSLPSHVRVSLYDRSKEKRLDALVDQALEGIRGLQISPFSLAAEGSSFDFASFSALKGVEGGAQRSLNSVAFFKPYLQSGQAFGTHHNSVVGDAGRFGQLDYYLQTQFMNWKAKAPQSTAKAPDSKAGKGTPFDLFPTSVQTLLIALSEQNVEQIGARYRGKLDPAQLADYLKLTKGALNLLKSDLRLRKRYGKTLLKPLQPETMKALIGLSQSPKQLQAFVAKHRRSFPAYKEKRGSGAEQVYTDEFIGEVFVSMPFDELQSLGDRLAKLDRQFLPSVGGQRLMELYWLKLRGNFLDTHGADGASQMAQEGLTDKALERIRAAKDHILAQPKRFDSPEAQLFSLIMN